MCYHCSPSPALATGLCGEVPVSSALQTLASAHAAEWAVTYLIQTTLKQEQCGVGVLDFTGKPQGFPLTKPPNA